MPSSQAPASVSTAVVVEPSKRRIDHPLLSIRLVGGSQPGVVVRTPRRLGGAVARNRARRQVRAALRDFRVERRLVVELKAVGKTFQDWQGAIGQAFSQLEEKLT